MSPYTCIFQLFLLAATSVDALTLHHQQARNDAIQWGPCSFNNTVPIQCAKLPVPLDYTDKQSNTTLNLDLIKVSAKIQPSKGSILLNFGGPGGDGLHNLALSAAYVLNITGGHHDLISFDPRGTGNTLLYSCYANDTVRSLAGIEYPQALANSSDAALGRLWAENSIFASTCYSQAKDFGSLVGTAFVARDMMRIVDALGEDGLLRYYGVSYGTALGATVAAMFPDRMDRVVLDGVVNTHEYYHGYNAEQVTDTDKTFRGFISGCVNASQNCALAQGNITAPELEDVILDLLQSIKYNPFPVGEYILDYTTIKTFIMSNLYYPNNWPLVSTVLSYVLSKDLEALAEIFLASVQTPEPGSIMYESLPGIKCSDSEPRATSLDELLPTFDQIYQTSKWFGDILGTIVTRCAQWPMAAKERYQGDFHVRTRNPILLIGNTFDPVTPLISAHNVSAGFEGSVVLQHNGYGHMSWAQASTCTESVIQNYFNNGTMPKSGTICQPDFPVFSSAT